MVLDCKLSTEARDALTSLAYSAWASAYDDLKAVKAERDDDSPDWQQFHVERLKNGTAREAKAQRVLNEIKVYSPLICGK